MTRPTALIAEVRALDDKLWGPADFARARTLLPALAEMCEVMDEALETLPRCFFCNGMGMRGPYERDTPDGSEIVPKHTCHTCNGSGKDAKAIAALARVEQIAKEAADAEA